MVTIVVGIVCAYAIKVTNDAKNTVGNITVDLSREQRTVSTADGEPLSFILMGIDEGTVTGDLDRTKDYLARSDSMMYVTLNPKTKQTTMVSLDRDLYVHIVGKTTDSGNPYYNKLNSAYAFGSIDGGTKGGAKMAIETVEEILDVPADHYITINMKGLEDLIDAVGGITVDNPYHFELDGTELYPGKQKVDGKAGLAYARYREYDAETGMGDPEGDIGRQARQREVIQAIVNKVLSLGTVSNYEKIFKAIEKNVTTDLSWENILNIAENYTSVMENVVPYQLQGQYHWFDGYYEILPINGLLKIQNVLKTQLGLQTSTTLPNLAGELDDNEYYFDDTHLDSDAGEREGIDDNLYFDNNILTPSQSIWTRDAYPTGDSTTSSSAKTTTSTTVEDVADDETADENE